MVSGSNMYVTNILHTQRICEENCRGKYREVSGPWAYVIQKRTGRFHFAIPILLHVPVNAVFKVLILNGQCATHCICRRSETRTRWRPIGWPGSGRSLLACTKLAQVLAANILERRQMMYSLDKTPQHQRLQEMSLPQRWKYLTSL